MLLLAVLRFFRVLLSHYFSVLFIPIIYFIRLIIIIISTFCMWWAYISLPFYWSSQVGTLWQQTILIPHCSCGASRIRMTQQTIGETKIWKKFILDIILERPHQLLRIQSNPPHNGGIDLNIHPCSKILCTDKAMFIYINLHKFPNLASNPLSLGFIQFIIWKINNSNLYQQFLQLQLK
jgi:hypothetical protein